MGAIPTAYRKTAYPKVLKVAPRGTLPSAISSSHHDIILPTQQQPVVEKAHRASFPQTIRAVTAGNRSLRQRCCDNQVRQPRIVTYHPQPITLFPVTQPTDSQRIADMRFPCRGESFLHNSLWYRHLSARTFFQVLLSKFALLFLLL